MPIIVNFVCLPSDIFAAADNDVLFGVEIEESAERVRGWCEHIVPHQERTPSGALPFALHVEHLPMNCLLSKSEKSRNV